MLWWTSGSEVIKRFSCSTQLSMNISPLINKMPTKVGFFIFISREVFMLITASKKDFAIVSNLRFIYKQDKCHAQLSWAWKKYYLGAWFRHVYIGWQWFLCVSQFTYCDHEINICFNYRLCFQLFTCFMWFFSHCLTVSCDFSPITYISDLLVQAYMFHAIFSPIPYLLNAIF